MALRFRIPGVLDIPAGVAFVHAGVKYPANWTKCASADDLAAIGMESYAPPPPPPPTNEERWTEIRKDRNGLLRECDWTQLPDSPVDRAAWAAYRQGLRDITKQADPAKVVWPDAPTLAP